MTDLYLDIDAFGGLIRDLDTAADDMKSANNRLADADGNDLGAPTLGTAADNFRNRWKYGIEKIAEATAAMVYGLEATHKLYAEQEHINSATLDAVDGALPEAPTPTSAGPQPQSSLNLGGDW